MFFCLFVGYFNFRTEVQDLMLSQLSRECNVLRKEKEAIVIRYANSEKEVIMDKKIQQDLEKKIKDLNKEREGLLLKLKNAGAENSRLSTLIENKVIFDNYILKYK